MRLLVAPPGYERETELAVIGAMKAVESLANIDKRGSHEATSIEGPTYVAVFTLGTTLQDAEAEIRRVVSQLVLAASLPKVA